MTKQNTYIPQEIAVSIVLPIYNAENHLERCLKSLVAQDLKNIELILVDYGSTDRAKSIYESFINKDERIKLIQSKSNSYGSACNLGIESSNGNYISFVMPEDWVESNMYQELYGLACKYNPDMIRCLTYNHKNNDVAINTDIYNKILLLNTVIKDKFLIPEIYLKDPTARASIYKLEVLKKNKVKFIEDASSEPQEITFAFLAFSSISSIYIYNSTLYHHDLYMEKQNSIANKNAFLEFKEHEYLQKHISSLSKDNRYLHIEASRLYKNIIIILNNKYITSEQKYSFVKNASVLLSFYLPSIDLNTYLSKTDRNKFKKITNHPILTILLNQENPYIKALLILANIKITKEVFRIKSFGIPIIFVKKTNNYKTFNICNIPIRRVRRNRSNTGKTITKYSYIGLPIYKRIDTKEDIKKYLAGFRISKKINFQAQLSDLASRISKIPSPEDIFYYTSMANTVASLHSKTFPQFKDINTDKSIVILGSGPSLHYAPQIEDAISICCNRTYDFFQNKNPDYIFVQDFLATRDYLEDLLKKNSKIFIGRYVTKGASIITLPEDMRRMDNIFNYFSGNKIFCSEIRPEIECNVLADFYTVVHPALHFALYTNARAIYLIGCDTSNNGYFGKTRVQAKFDPQILIEGYEKFKIFRDRHFPKTKIISVNPVALKGIFEDVYTKDFVDSNHDMDISTIEIIEKI